MKPRSHQKVLAAVALVRQHFIRAKVCSCVCLQSTKGGSTLYQGDLKELSIQPQNLQHPATGLWAFLDTSGWSAEHSKCSTVRMWAPQTFLHHGPSTTGILQESTGPVRKSQQDSPALVTPRWQPCNSESTRKELAASRCRTLRTG